MAEATKTTKQVADLPEAIFAVTMQNHELLKLAYEAYLANGRPNLAKTLRRGEVSGGGKKPWKQKGTGRARFGSSRNPIWRKGGVVFGPLGIENYSKTISTSAKRVALRQALTLAAQAGAIIVIDDIQPTGKTKDMVALLAKHEVANHKHVVVAVEHKTPELVRASRNIQNLIVSQATYLNVYNILNADKLLIAKSALNAINTWLGGDK
ncbi:MAG TPA: 50S ribosomal protein L4 [Candidatus Acidoferrum sp.]|nr:50S ribosomal protein L4 [Candidatus Acidoferrum sp.]